MNLVVAREILFVSPWPQPTIRFLNRHNPLSSVAKENVLFPFSPSRRDLLKAAAAASTGAAPLLAAHANSHSPELLALNERLEVARAQRDRLQQIAKDAEGARPPLPEGIEHTSCRTQKFQPNNKLQEGKLDPAELAKVLEPGVPAADLESKFDRQISALEAAESIVCDIERAIVDFEPRSIADLRLQVELALHQEVIDYGMDENLPSLICERFLRLIPAQSESRDELEAVSNARRRF